MPIKSRDEGLGVVHYDSDYHQRSWVEFTTLTETEWENLKEIYGNFGKIRKEVREFT